MILNLKLAILCIITFSILTAQEIKVGEQTWMKNNLDVTSFRNGDEILHAKTKEEWIQACENNIPAWCYYDNDSFSIYNYSKLYNLSAVQDPRGLAPEGWKIPAMEDYKTLLQTYQRFLEKLPQVDTAKYVNEMLDLIPLFQKAENDSLFAAKHSIHNNFDKPIRIEVPITGSRYTSISDVFKKAVPEINNAEIGDVLGPYIDVNEIILYKVVDHELKEYATARHILLQSPKDEDRTKYHNRADSIINAIESKNNFEEMVKIYSDDPGSIDNGGIYHNFSRNIMVKNFEDFSFNQPVGTLGKVESNYGIHIIEVLKREKILQSIVIPIKKNIMQDLDITYLIAGDGENSSYDIVYFNVVPGGYRTPDGQFMKGGIQGVLWSTTIFEDVRQIFLSVIYGIDVSMGATDENLGLSVRCIR